MQMNSVALRNPFIFFPPASVHEKKTTVFLLTSSRVRINYSGRCFAMKETQREDTEKMPINIWPRARTPDKKRWWASNILCYLPRRTSYLQFKGAERPHTYSIIMCVCVISRYGGWRSHQAESGCIPARISGATIKIMPPPPPPSSFLSLGARIIIYVGEFYEAHNIELQFICQRHAIKYCAHADLTKREFFLSALQGEKLLADVARWWCRGAQLIFALRQRYKRGDQPANC